MLVAKHNTSNITTSKMTSSHKRAVNYEQKHFFITHKEMSTKCTTVHESNKSIGRGSIGKQNQNRHISALNEQYIQDIKFSI